MPSVPPPPAFAGACHPAGGTPGEPHPMSTHPHAEARAGAVFNHASRRHEPRHERDTQVALARRLADLLGLDFGGRFDPSASYPGRVYLVPSGTLIGLDTAHRLGVRSEADLFGGVVPEEFICTKAITHPLVAPDAHAPAGWSPAFGERVHDAVLRGLTAFTREDAMTAGRRLLEHGPARLKPVRATAGRGQVVVESLDDLAAALDALGQDEIGGCGVVLEENLVDVITYSVGQVRVGDWLATYTGTQRLTTANDGEVVYGGSDLLVANGDFDALLALELPEDVRRAVAQARCYDEAARACYPGFFASRRNYDTVAGTDAAGETRSGVLEQSWRIGGASPAEILALQAFRDQPGLAAVHARCVEVFGADAPVPPQATVLFRGEDEDIGFITKYVETTPYGNTK